MADAIASIDLPARRFERAPRRALIGAVALIVVGGIALLAALLTDADRAWRAYLFNWLFFTGIAQGAVLLAAVVTMTIGVWSRGVRRIAVAFVVFLPIAYLLLIPILVAAPHILPWVGESLHPPKSLYLNMPFLVIRHLIALAAVTGVSLLFAYWSLRPDLGLLRAETTGRLRGTYDWFTRGWMGQEAEEARAYRKLAVLGPVMALLYAVEYTFIAWDFVMSLEPEWFSTLIGPYFFMAAFLGGLAVVVLATIAFVRAFDVKALVPPTQLHDMGKLTFAFVVFWGYLFFAQFIIIWYGLLPTEQSFVIHRFVAPYDIVAKIVLVCMFVLPFFGLLGVAPKKRPAILGMFAGIILFGLWMERYLLVYPSLYMGPESLPFGWQEIGIALLYAGLLIGSLLYFATRFPMFQLWQPMSELELEGVYVQKEDVAV